jgi:misacylated tRNA(Ala) deacylase
MTDRCCGTHIPNIHNLNLFLVPHTESLSRSTLASARLYFFAGPRLVAHLASTHQLLTSSSATLSCGVSMVPERITQVINERRTLEKRLEDVEGEMAGFIARELVQKMSLQDKSLGLFKMHLHRTDDSGSLRFMSTVASAFFNVVQTSPQALTQLSNIVVLSSSPSSQSASSTSVVLAFGSGENMVQEVGGKLKVQLSIKGGGKGQRWSGKFTGVWKAEREGAVIDEVLQGVGEQIE